jgi:GntR family transcriptional regulator/MocR family aminotransferase
MAVAEFLRDGHYLRHLRRMKRLYAARRDRLKARLAAVAPVEAMAGLAVLLRLPDGIDDVALADAALAHGMAPGALSGWYADPARRRTGLLLGVTNAAEDRLDAACARLAEMVQRF